jgi:hypothetical protein
MEKKHVFIHIGPPKTGSTTIQTQLTNEAASERPFIYYPEAGRLNEGKPTLRRNGEKVYSEQYHVINHTNTYYALLGTMVDPTSKDVLDMLTAEMEVCEHRCVVISSEGFFSLDEQIPQLLECCGDYSIKVILYIRDPTKRIISSYKEKVRSENMTISFEKFIQQEGCLVQEPEVIERWARYVGHENIIKRLFDRVIAGPGLWTDFCEATGNGGEADKVATKENRDNEKWPDQLLVMIRLLSKCQKRCAIGGIPFLVLINLKRLITRSRVVQYFLCCILFPFRNVLIPQSGIEIVSQIVGSEIGETPPCYRSLYNS